MITFAKNSTTDEEITIFNTSVFDGCLYTKYVLQGKTLACMDS